MRFSLRRKFLGRSPLTIVELVITISTIVGGLYVLTPALVGPELTVLLTGAPGIIQFLGSTIPLIIFGAGLVLAGVVEFYGIWSRKAAIRATALFFNIMLRLYALIATTVTNGLIPLTWLSPTVVLITCIICYLVVRGQIVRGIEA